MGHGSGWVFKAGSQPCLLCIQPHGARFFKPRHYSRNGGDAQPLDSNTSYFMREVHAICSLILAADCISDGVPLGQENSWFKESQSEDWGDAVLMTGMACVDSAWVMNNHLGCWIRYAGVVKCCEVLLMKVCWEPEKSMWPCLVTLGLNTGWSSTMLFNFWILNRNLNRFILNSEKTMPCRGMHLTEHPPPGIWHWKAPAKTIEQPQE